MAKAFVFEERNDLNLAISRALSDEFEPIENIAARMGFPAGQKLLPKMSYTLASYLPSIKALGLFEIKKEGSRSLYRRAQSVSAPPADPVVAPTGSLKMIALVDATPVVPISAPPGGSGDEPTRTNSDQSSTSAIVPDPINVADIKEPFTQDKNGTIFMQEPPIMSLSIDELISKKRQELADLEKLHVYIKNCKDRLGEIDRRIEQLNNERNQVESDLAQHQDRVAGFMPVAFSQDPIPVDLAERIKDELKKVPQHDRLIVAPSNPATVSMVVRNGAWLFRWVQSIASNLHEANLGLPQSPFTFVPMKIKTKLAETITQLRKDGSAMTDLNEQQVKHVGTPVVLSFERVMIEKYGSSGYKPTDIYQELTRR